LICIRAVASLAELAAREPNTALENHFPEVQEVSKLLVSGECVSEKLEAVISFASEDPRLEKGAALRRAAGRDRPCARAAPAFHVHRPQDAAPVFPIPSRAHQGTLPHRPSLPGRVPAHHARPARGHDRRRHPDSCRDTFGEYLDFHPHLHALVADGLFVDSGLFHVMPDVSLAPLEELFRARVITFLVKKGLLPPERARMLRGWTHSGFNAHRSQRVPPRNREDMERLAQYIIRNPFSVDKMQPNSSGDSIIYRSGMNPKIQRNFEVFSPCDFIARITQHIPDKSFQLVRYYGWYSNKMRGQRLKQTEAEVVDAPEGDVIDVSAFKPRRIPSKKWRELIKKVWEADPLLCPRCQHEMRIVALIDEAAVIERILRHLGLWEAGVRVDAARDPPEPAEPVIEPWLDDPFPDYDNEPVFAEN
jgi:hypothetical protein